VVQVFPGLSHGLLLVVNNADSPPFATLIAADKQNGQLTLGARITFTTATNGAEQPVWDPGARRFYQSIPEGNGPGDGTGPNEAVARINPKTAVVETMFPVQFCQPAGLTVGPDKDLLLGCSQALILPVRRGPHQIPTLRRPFP
jgi:hypothetical protein